MDTTLTEKCFKGMEGAYAALVTPFDEKGRVNQDRIGEIIEYGLLNGLRGFYLTGSTGEWWLLTNEERRQVMRAAVRASKGRAKLIAHVGATRTDDAVELARDAAKIGIEWISAIAPQIYRTSFDAACYHYRAIAAATDLPFLVYSLGTNILPERDVRLFDIPGVKGVKYTGRDYYAAQRLRRRLDRETIWFAGCDEQLVCALALGNVFSGGIGSTYNIIPAHFAGIYERTARGDFAGAALLQDEANRVVELMIESDNWSYFKAMMKFIGLDCGYCRRPFEPLTAAQYRAHAKRFAALGIVAENQARAQLDGVRRKPRAKPGRG